MTTPSNLVPGSIWQRSTKKGFAHSTVLFVTNEGATQEVLEAHPQQVVFLTEAFKVLSMDVESFTAKRSYVDMDSDIEALLGMITSPPVEDEEDVNLDIDNIEVDESLFPQTEQATAVEDLAASTTEVPWAPRLNVGPHVFAEALQSNFIAYSESPFHTGDTLHTLKFALSSNLTLADIRKAFTVSDPNSIAKFEVTSATGSFQVEVAGFVDVMLECVGEDFGCLYVTSEGDFRAPPEVEQPVEVTTVENTSIQVSVV